MTLLQDFSADAGSTHPVRRLPEGSLVPEPHSLTTLFADLPLSPEIRREVQEMAQTSPARTVGKGRFEIRSFTFDPSKTVAHTSLRAIP